MFWMKNFTNLAILKKICAPNRSFLKYWNKKLLASCFLFYYIFLHVYFIFTHWKSTDVHLLVIFLFFELSIFLFISNNYLASSDIRLNEIHFNSKLFPTTVHCMKFQQHQLLIIKCSFNWLYKCSDNDNQKVIMVLNYYRI